MTFLAPDPTGLAGTLGLNGDQGLPPLSPNAPNAVKSLNNKYTPSNIQAMRSQYGPDITDRLLKWEFQRAQRGISPAPTQATINLLNSAKTKAAATAAPERDPLDFLGNAASDVGDIVTSIPKLPFQVAHDVIHAPEALDALATGDINKIANAPVIRMIPGVYTASNLLQGNVSELVSHPVMTALDVLPYASHFGVGDMVKKIKVPGVEGDLTLGDVVDRAKAAAGRSMPGQFVREAWSPESRGASAALAQQANLLGQRGLPQLAKFYDTAIDRLRQEGTPVAARYDAAFKDVAPEVRTDAFRAVEDPASFGVKTVDDALGSLPLNDAQLAAVNDFRMWRNSAQQYGLDAASLQNRTMQGVNEVLNTSQAQRLDSIRSKVAHAETMTNLLDAVQNPDPGRIADLQANVREAMHRPGLKGAQLQNIAQGYIHALDMAGYDTAGAFTELGRMNKAGVIGFIDNYIPERAEVPVGPDGNPMPASPRERPARGKPALDARTRWEESNKLWTQGRLDKLHDVMGAQEAKVLPARWQAAFQRIKMDEAKNYIEQTFAPDDAAVPALMDAVHEHLYRDAFSREEVSKINKEALDAITKLREQGYNPEFVHHVSPQQERALASPSVTTIVPKASQYGVRINDWTPSSDSLSVSITHQGLELGRREAVQNALGTIRDTYAPLVRDAEAEMRPVARRAAARNGTTLGAELERLMQKEYVRWSETENGFMAGKAKRFQFTDTQFHPDERVIPRHLARSLEMVASPPAYSRIFDPYLKVFRTAVLPFSPRFHINNIVGGMVGAVLEDPRILGKTSEAWKVAGEMEKLNKALAGGSTDFTLSDSTMRVLESMPESMRAEFGGLKYSVAPDTEFKFKGGGKLGEWAQQAGMDRLLKAGKRAEDWSYSFNELNDNMYRVASYLSGEQNALTKGLSAEEASARGMALAQKVQPRWLEMTPMERSVFRVIFPFYGFMSHIFRFAARFPIDHPWRTATMANFARAELDDFGTGLPQMLASTFFLGSPDKAGNVTAFTPGAMNPFRDLGDNMTLAGFMSQTNPLFKVALKHLGYDPTSRGPNLYPEVQYDPKTGGFKTVQTNTPGLLSELGQSILPQAAILQALAGTSGDFRNLLESNPAAAGRMLMSTSGVPVLWRQYNVNDETFKAETARQADTKTVLSTALRTGDYSHLERYPTLRPYIGQLQKLQAAGKLAAYQGQGYSLVNNQAQQVGSQANTQAEVKAG